MAKRTGIEVSIAASHSVALCDVDVISAYPITPQTHIVEHLSEMVANGEFDCEYIPVESEHSAMSCCVGSAAAGARTFTATAAQGLALMHEIVFIAASMRFPIVMTVANRTLSAPLTIWGDHSDVMSERDSGWIQLFTTNGQEVHDFIIMAYRIAENRNVMLPVMVNLDGFHLSHVIEPIEIYSQEEIDGFLPPYSPPYRLDPHNVLSMGCFTMPQYFMEIKKQHDEVLKASRTVIDDVFREFNEKFGRNYEAVMNYRVDDADTVILMAGSFCETAQMAVDRLREKGEKIGLVNLKLWRPFPGEDLKKILGSKKLAICIERAISPAAASAPITQEIRSLLYHDEKKPQVVNFITGLSGRDVNANQFIEMIEKAKLYSKSGDIPGYEMFGVRE